jgi:uroporphyrinogen-III synthase
MPNKYKNILLTRDLEGNALWGDQLKVNGFKTTKLPCIYFLEFKFTEQQVSEITKRLLASDYIIWTSVRGVHFSKKFLSECTSFPKLCAVGLSTAQALSHVLAQPYLISEEMNANGLAKKILSTEVITGKKITLLLAKNAPNYLENILLAEGAKVERIDIYETKPVNVKGRSTLSSLNVDAVIIASPSAIDGLLNQYEIDLSIDIYPIGPTTKMKLESLGLKCKNIPKHPGIEGIIEEITCQ